MLKWTQFIIHVVKLVFVIYKLNKNFRRDSWPRKIWTCITELSIFLWDSYCNPRPACFPCSHPHPGVGEFSAVASVPMPHKLTICYEKWSIPIYVKFKMGWSNFVTLIGTYKCFTGFHVYFCYSDCYISLQLISKK